MKPARPRNTSALDELKRRVQRFLRRELTPREEFLLELSEPILDSDQGENDQTKAA